jgi:hypothetical protein
MVASRQHLLLLKNKTANHFELHSQATRLVESAPYARGLPEHTRGELNGLVVHGDVRIGLTLYSSSCSTRYELNLLLGRKKMSVKKN